MAALALAFAALLPASAPAAGAEAAVKRADFRAETASADARGTADWVAASGDNQGLPFMIVDKANAKVFLFDSQSRIRGTAPALLGIGRGDGTAPGIGQRRLATMTTAEKTTPAGRFQASLGHDFEQDILWIDYDSALSLHRVIPGKPKERRLQRLASATTSDNRITYGCINVPVKFYETVVVPAFTGTVGIVYILPESSPPGEVFPMSPATRGSPN
jgi:hypothetical protein